MSFRHQKNPTIETKKNILNKSKILETKLLASDGEIDDNFGKFILLNEGRISTEKQEDSLLIGYTKSVSDIIVSKKSNSDYQSDFLPTIDQELYKDFIIISDDLTNSSSENILSIENSNFIFVEHPNVYTLGKSGDLNNLLLSEEDLKRKEIQFFNTNRGGDITCHGPGQIVCYPIFDLDNFFTDIHKYLRFLELAVINTLKDLNIHSSNQISLQEQDSLKYL